MFTKKNLPQWEVDEKGVGGQKIKTSSYKINMSQRCNVQHGNYS